jgi:HEPN domain-containing protein
LKTSLHHLPILKRIELNAIKKISVRVARPEKVILFGLHAEQPGNINFDTLPPVAQAYNLLVIIGGKDLRGNYRILDKIEQNCSNCAPTTAIVYDNNYVCSKLEEGNYFFYEIEQKGIVLYDTGKGPLTKATPPDLLQFKIRAEKDFARWGKQAYAFYTCAIFKLDKDNKAVCMFLLHQAAEQMYQAIILTHTGHKPITHNMDKLRRYTMRLSPELAGIFPTDTPKERRLLALVVASYIGARYNEEFDLTCDDLRFVVEKVGRLLSIGDRLCREQLSKLDSLISSNIRN